MTNTNGYPTWSATYLPFGQEWNPQPTVNHYKFTGYERDGETGNDYAVARYFSSQYGRFLSADPLAGDITNPQSLNRYAYVRNNPINFIDPLGLDDCSSSSSGISCTFNYFSFGDPFVSTIYDPWVFGLGMEDPGSYLSCMRNYHSIHKGAPPPGTCRPGWKPKSTVSRAKPELRKCHIEDPLSGSVELTAKAGAEVHFGVVKAGMSFYDNITTGQTGVKAEGGLLLVSGSIDRPTPYGGSLNGNAPPAERSISFLGVTYSFATGNWSFKPTFDVQAIIRGEATFNSDTWVYLNKVNDACRAQRGR